jgi:hypothetical protein
MAAAGQQAKDKASAMASDSASDGADARAEDRAEDRARNGTRSRPGSTAEIGRSDIGRRFCMPRRPAA